MRRGLPIAAWLVAGTGAVAGPAKVGVAAVGLGVIVALALRARLEEAELRVTYADYGAYAARTARFVPFVL